MTREQLAKYIDRYRQKEKEGDTVWLEKQRLFLEEADALLDEMMSISLKALEKTDKLLNKCGALN